MGGPSESAANALGAVSPYSVQFIDNPLTELWNPSTDTFSDLPITGWRNRQFGRTGQPVGLDIRNYQQPAGSKSATAVPRHIDLRFARDLPFHKPGENHQLTINPNSVIINLPLFTGRLLILQIINQSSTDLPQLSAPQPENVVM